MATKKLKIAFGAFRTEPFTNGHYRIFTEMIRDNDLVIIGLGSAQLSNTPENPFSIKQRINFIRTVFGRGSKDKLKIVPLYDIGATKESDWVDYCMEQIDIKNLPTPTRYYAGSETDLHWFKNSVNINREPIELINLNRHETNMLSGTLVRQSLSMGTDEWKSHVPECIIDIIEEEYPIELTLKYQQRIKEQNE